MSNLVSLGDRPLEERREIARKGGIASGVSRRRAKTMREAAKLLLESGVSGDVDGDTNAEVLVSTILRKAIDEGDVLAADKVFKWAGEESEDGKSTSIQVDQSGVRIEVVTGLGKELEEALGK